MTSTIKQIWRETRGNFLVEALKYIAGVTVLKSVGAVVWGSITHAPLYWRFLLAEFFVGLFVFAEAVWLRRASGTRDVPEEQESIKTQIVELPTPKERFPQGSLFSPLQLEVMQLVRGLKQALANAGPPPVFVVQPDNIDQGDLEDRLTNWNRLLREWSAKIEANYKLFFATRTETVRLQINAMPAEKPTQIETDLWSLEAIPGRGVKSTEEVREIIEALQRLFLFLDEQNSESPIAGRAQSA